MDSLILLALICLIIPVGFVCASRFGNVLAWSFDNRICKSGLAVMAVPAADSFLNRRLPHRTSRSETILSLSDLATPTIGLVITTMILAQLMSKDTVALQEGVDIS